MLTYCKIHPANNQIELHPYCQQPELVEFCQKNNITLTAYSPLSAPGRKFGGNKGGSALENSTIKEIAETHEKSEAQIALAWNLNRDVCVIPKSSSLKRARENMEASQISLSPDEMKSLSKIDKKERIFDPIHWDCSLFAPYFC